MTISSVDEVYGKVVNVPVSKDKVQIHFFVEREWRDVADGLRTVGLLDNVSDELATAYKRMLLEKIRQIDPNAGPTAAFYRTVEKLRDEINRNTQTVIENLTTIASCAEIIEERERQDIEKREYLEGELQDWFVEIGFGNQNNKNLLYLYSKFATVFLNQRELEALSKGSFSAQHRLETAIRNEKPDMVESFNTLWDLIYEKYGNNNLNLFYSYVGKIISEKKV